MERLGFIQDMMDVKVLLLFVAARLKGAATVQELYELAYQDERLSYFDVCTAVPELVRSGHLQELPGERYTVTEKGRTDGAVTEDSLAFPVKQRAQKAVRLSKSFRKNAELIYNLIMADLLDETDFGE